MTAYLRDAAVEKKDLTGTFHGYGTVSKEEQRRLEHCFTRGAHILAETYKEMDEPVDENYCSDHHGIYMELILTA